MQSTPIRVLSGDIGGTKTRPFNKPESSKIAVKVINHYGDEVLKVFEVFRS